MPATPVWLAAVESGLNRSIGRSPQAALAARRLERTSLQVHIEGVGRVRAAVCGERLALGAGEDGNADAQITGTPLALFNLLMQGAAGGARDKIRPGTIAGAGAERGRAPVRISGNAEVAGGYRELIALARPDLEEELARIVGDLPARRISLAVREALGWLRKLERTARENLAEYLQEESRDLAGRCEVEEFVQGVDAVRDTEQRIEARLARLEQRFKGPA